MGSSNGNDSDDGGDEGNAAQADHIAFDDQVDHDAYDDHAHVLAVEFPIVEFAEHIVDSCEAPFL